ncbi:MAG: DUF3298 and DUF4163 domain-containing protein [Clostridiales bacterium]|nr:DUF3298 and DUF4163 domain-containing protein [Clostridiales bacterium]
MKRWLVLVLTVMGLFCGCSADGEYNVLITKEEQETDYSTVYAEVIAFGGFANKEYEETLNAEIENNISAAIGEFDQLAQENAQSMPPGIKSDLHITQSVKRNSGGIISFVTENYTYFGGAHGNTVWYPQTIDIRQEAPHNMELSELFKDEAYIEKINNLIDVMVKENPDKYSELWAEPHITEKTKYEYYLTDEELVIWFPPYELSYYAKGFIEFPIRLTELSGLLKEEYRTAE